MANLTYSNADENRFWLQIIGDYARLLMQAFSPDQRGEIGRARDFISQFDNLLVRARQNLTADQLAQLNKDAYAAVQNIQKFFLQMLSLQIRSGAPILIKSAVINNAVTFTEQYFQMLNSFIKNEQPEAFTAIQLEMYWLPRLIQMAKVISDSLGLYQTKLREKADSFSNEFTDLLLASMDLYGMTRIGTSDFPIMNEHHSDVVNVLKEFTNYLESLLSLCRKNAMPGTLSGLYLDRTDRMVCYFLKQIQILIDSEQPDCDPARPRCSNI